MDMCIPLRLSHVAVLGDGVSWDPHDLYCGHLGCFVHLDIVNDQKLHPTSLYL